MSQFSSDVRLLIFIFGLFWGIIVILKEYRRNMIRTIQKSFHFFVLSVFFFELVLLWGIITMCSDLLSNVKNIGSYAIFSWALSCFSYSRYMFTGVAFSDDNLKMEKFRGKVAIGMGVYFLLIAIVTYEM